MENSPKQVNKDYLDSLLQKSLFDSAAAQALAVIVILSYRQNNPLSQYLNNARSAARFWKFWDLAYTLYNLYGPSDTDEAVTDRASKNCLRQWMKSGNWNALNGDFQIIDSRDKKWVYNYVKHLAKEKKISSEHLVLVMKHVHCAPYVVARPTTQK